MSVAFGSNYSSSALSGSLKDLLESQGGIAVMIVLSADPGRAVLLSQSLSLSLGMFLLQEPAAPDAPSGGAALYFPMGTAPEILHRSALNWTAGASTDSPRIMVVEARMGDELPVSLLAGDQLIIDAEAGGLPAMGEQVEAVHLSEDLWERLLRDLPGRG